MVVRESQRELDQVWRALERVKDPEIPVISVVELGLVRKVKQSGSRLQVTLTPTFSGCPALDVIRETVARELVEAGFGRVRVTYQLSPPWTTDDISPEGREKLRTFGLAPPERHGGNLELVVLEQAACPYCGSEDTELKNSFGSTLCRTIHYCNNCQQPFEGFKPL